MNFWRRLLSGKKKPDREQETRKRSTALDDQLTICETSTSMWSYHLRIPEKGPQYSGAYDAKALCGAKIGWDVPVPLSTWGTKSHVPYKWCRECARLGGFKEESCAG